MASEGTMEGVPPLHAEPEMRIDGYAADLVPISWLGVSPTGTIAILQTQDHVVRLFDSVGSPVGSVGGDGEGPGEFRTLQRGGWKADTLWVSDFALHRVTLISPEVAFLRTLLVPSEVRPLPEDSSSVPTFVFAFPYAVYTGDSLLLWAQSGDPRAEALGGAPLLRASADGWIRNVIPMPPSRSSISIPLPKGAIGIAQVPYYPERHWAVSPDGNVIAIVTTTMGDGANGSLTVRLLNAQGAELVSREFSFEGVPIPARVADSVVQLKAEQERIPAVKRVYQTRVRDLMPRAYPPVRDVVVANDHRVWVGLRPTAQGSPWLVLDTGATPAGILTLPPRSSVRAATADHVWVVERDDMDVESIVGYRLH